MLNPSRVDASKAARGILEQHSTNSSALSTHLCPPYVRGCCFSVLREAPLQHVTIRKTNRVLASCCITPRQRKKRAQRAATLTEAPSEHQISPGIVSSQTRSHFQIIPSNVASGNVALGGCSPTLSTLSLILELYQAHLDSDTKNRIKTHYDDGLHIKMAKSFFVFCGARVLNGHPAEGSVGGGVIHTHTRG